MPFRVLTWAVTREAALPRARCFPSCRAPAGRDFEWCWGSPSYPWSWARLAYLASLVIRSAEAWSRVADPVMTLEELLTQVPTASVWESLAHWLLCWTISSHSISSCGPNRFPGSISRREIYFQPTPRS